MIKRFFPIIALIILTLLPSCIPTKGSKKVFAMSGERVRLNIRMPKNKVVFENLSPIVYDALWQHFEHVGFSLAERKAGCYSLRVTIKNIDTDYKFLSPDLLSYATKIRIELLCELFDKEDKPCAKKLFVFRTLISKAENCVENSKFADFEYKRLLRREVHKIDQYFRPFIFKET